MRYLITVLSLLLFALSGIIIFHAMKIPERHTSFQTGYKKTETEQPYKKPEQSTVADTQKKEMSSELLMELQATIARLEDKVSQKDQEIREKSAIQKPAKTERVLATLGGGSFRSGQVVMNEMMIKTIGELVEDILASPDSRVVIEGHTDNIPIKSYEGKPYMDNMDLSFLRAKAVARILAEQGVPDHRISVTGYGDTRPVESNDSAEGRAKNRRVEVKLIPE